MVWGFQPAQPADKGGRLRTELTHMASDSIMPMLMKPQLKTQDTEVCEASSLVNMLICQGGVLTHKERTQKQLCDRDIPKPCPMCLVI
jgi:hypothetical protein